MALSAQIRASLLALPEAERIALARLLVQNIAPTEPTTPTMQEAMRRLEELVSGKSRVLTEEEFRRELAR